jgi:hypothetical protein
MAGGFTRKDKRTGCGGRVLFPAPTRNSFWSLARGVNSKSKRLPKNKPLLMLHLNPNLMLPKYIYIYIFEQIVCIIIYY